MGAPVDPVGSVQPVQAGVPRIAFQPDADSVKGLLQLAMTGVTAAQKPLLAQADGLAAGAHKKLARTRVANPGFGHVFIIGVGHHGIVRTSAGGATEWLRSEERRGGTE